MIELTQDQVKQIADESIKQLSDNPCRMCRCFTEPGKCCKMQALVFDYYMDAFAAGFIKSCKIRAELQERLEALTAEGTDGEK